MSAAPLSAPAAAAAACTVCSRMAKDYPDIAMLRHGDFLICGYCVKEAAKRAAEIEARYEAKRVLAHASDAPVASLRDLISGMASSIRRDPDEWWTNGYKLMHANGVRVWIANGRDYLKITVPERGDFPRLASAVSVRNDGWAQRGGIDRVLSLSCGRTYKDCDTVLNDKNSAHSLESHEKMFTNVRVGRSRVEPRPQASFSKSEFAEA